MRRPNFLGKKLINCRDPLRFFGRAEGGGKFSKSGGKWRGVRNHGPEKTKRHLGDFFHRSFGKKVFDDSGGGEANILGGENFGNMFTKPWKLSHGHS